MKKSTKKSFIINLLNKTHIFFYKNFIIVKGPRGIICYSKFNDYSKYKVIFNKNFLTISFIDNLINENNLKLTKLNDLIEKLMFGVNYFFSKKLFFIGIGLKAWIKTISINKKILVIKIGFSNDLLIAIPKSILIFALKSNILLIKGLSKEKIYQFASFIRLHKKPESYKGYGIQYKNEKLILKQGKIK